ncbi:DUF4349 domain-containing protein [Neolewinella aurantiaca]|uniref:DUF4349 domain-containing protein n=1 Tax=Neolewinella aurantiaca TaxID=2602767 RepID=A0A5C7FLC3_9BACT|nr:DUF4349 domain-containing protein [Neolewinella aurantiaca]TXF90843.1 DUF4349 domain-containing protein [Neolewinella aurantiaca]
MKYATLFILSIVLALSGCSSKAYLASGVGAAYFDGERSEQQVNDDERKLLYSASLGVTVAEPDSALSVIVAMTKEFDGYVNRTSSYGATIRVPAAELDEVISRISTLGEVTRKNITAEDVTEAYFDMGIRLDNAEKARQRYLELLARAQNVEETLLVERELERLTETIDLLKGRINRIDQQEAYSSISVDLARRARPGPLGYVFKGAYSAVKWLFVRN